MRAEIYPIATFITPESSIGFTFRSKLTYDKDIPIACSGTTFPSSDIKQEYKAITS